jgi:stalled ribosome rescue protein Dom34
MSEHYYALVWIDHHEARIFHFNALEAERATVRSTHPHQHLHHKANTRDSGHAPIDQVFLEHVAQAVMPAGAVLITGPASAKKELAAYIAQRHEQLSRRICGVETVDHPSDGELLALARKFFRADDRMREQMHR